MKKITLGIAAILAAFTMNAQSDCSTAQAVVVADNASTTVNAPAISGTLPTTRCNTLATANATTSDWYSFTPSGSSDVVTTVTITGDINNFIPSFSLYTGTCGNLTCFDDFIGEQRGYVDRADAEVQFIAESGTTYYMVIDDVFTTNGVGTLAPFTIDISTDSNIPVAPGVAVNPTPANGATDIPVLTGTLTDGTSVYFVEASWDAPTTGGDVVEYFVIVSTNPDSSQWNTNNTITRNIDGSETSAQFFSPDATPAGFIQSNTTYYWTVQPTNISGIDPNGTPIWSFTTGNVDDEMSAENLEEKSSLTHYVTNDFLNISSTSQLSSVILYDMLGKKVDEKISNNNNEQINISNLQAGIYIAKVSAEGQTKTFKFVKK